MRRVFIIIMALLFINSVGAQTVKEAEALYNTGKYPEAVALYEQLVNQNPNDATLRLKMGKSYLKNNQPAQAIPCFEFARRKKLMRGERCLGDSYLLMYRFDEAVKAYENYIKHFKEASDILEAEQGLARAEQALKMLERIEDVTMLDSFYLDANEFLSAYKLNRELGEVMPLAQLFGSRVPENLFAYMSGRQDRIIYPQEVDGQTDLMIAYRLGDNWSESTTLQGNINSNFNENYPYMMPDGVMLYFASEGHNSLGGYDIFVSRYNSGNNSYSTPQNVGMPFNSPYNDYLLVIDEFAKVGWFVTDRFQPQGRVIVYEFVPNNEKIILEELEPQQAVALASLKEIHWAESHFEKTMNNAEGQVGIAPLDSIYFIVNDNMIYTSMKDFKSEEAKKLYQESVDKLKRLKTLYVLLDGKRRELFLTDDEQDKLVISEDIVQLEQEINDLQKQHVDLMVQSRRLELAKVFS